MDKVIAHSGYLFFISLIICGLGETAQNALKSAIKIFPDTFKIKN
jgi:NADH:ubiquinone oxidoreductase subunit F (NADH-binding)